MYSRYDQNVAELLRQGFNRRLFVMGLMLFALGSHAEVRAEYAPAEFSSVTSPQEARLNTIREQEIQQLKAILQRSITKDQRADLLLRLGEVYNELYRFYFFKENQLWNKKSEEFLANPQNAKSKKRPKPDNKKSQKFLTESVRYLENILQTIGSYEKLDEVYYYLGFNHWELGNREKSTGYFRRIVRQHPRSNYVSEAHRYIADFEFANRRFKEALANYQAAGRDSKAPTYPRVLYGTAWSFFKVGQPKRALDTMVQAIRLSKDVSEEEAIKRGTSLQNDAYDAMVLFYSEAGKPNQAQEFFTKEVGEEAAPELLSKLLAIYQKQGRYGEALTTSKQLETVDDSVREAGSAQRYEILQNALKLAQQQRNNDRELALLNTMIAEFIRKDSTEEIQTAIRANVRNSALQAHKESEKAANRRAAEQRAISLYKLYLATFSEKTEKSDVYEINYYLADLYSQADRHRDAAAQYRLLLRAALNDKGNSYLQKVQRSTAEGVIYSLDAYFKSRGRDVPSSKQEVDELLEAIDAFVELYPSDKESPKFVARAAGLLKDDRARKEEYQERLRVLIERYPGSPQALEAAVLQLREAEQKNDFTGVQALVKAYLGNERLMAQDTKGDFRQQLEGVLSKAKFKDVKDLEDGSQFAEAAVRFEQLARESKDRDIRFKALNNAAVNFGKAGDEKNEIRIYKEIAKQYPNQEGAAERILGIADSSFLAGDYKDAAEKYEEYFALVEPRIGSGGEKTKDLALNAIRNAAFLREALNQEEQAGENIRRIVRAANQKLPGAKAVAEDFLFDRATRWRKAGDKVEAVDAYKRYLSAFPQGRFSVESTVHLGNLYNDLREPEKSQAYLAKGAESIRNKSKLSRTELAYAAEARIQMLDGLEQAYRKSQLSLPEDRLKQDVKNKLQRLEQLTKGYLQVVEYGDGRWALEAFYKMAAAYKDFAEQIESAPIPANYQGEDKVKFQNQLKAVARPVRLKVLETLQTALKQGEQLAVGDPAMARVYVANTLYAPDTGLPLVYEVDFSDAKRWIMGEWGGEVQERAQLKQNPKNLKALVAVGNAHLVRGEERFARIYYVRALQINSKYVPALNNLAYLEGREGNTQAALAGFKQALQIREFELQPKHNMARIHMASGLWRHALLAYRQLEVRSPNDEEIQRGLGLSLLATGKADRAREMLKGKLSNDLNGRFAKAVMELGEGDRDSARREFASLANKSEYARMITEHWKR